MKNSLRIVAQCLLNSNQVSNIVLFELFTSDSTIEMIIYMFYMV